jgi:hypothetical protein
MSPQRRRQLVEGCRLNKNVIRLPMIAAVRHVERSE